MTKLSASQELDLAIVAAADQRWRDAKRTTEGEVRREIRARTRHLMEARNDSALLARDAGIPATQIAYVGLHTKSTAAARAAMADARERRRLRDEAQPPRFTRGEGAGEVVVRLHGAELDSAARAVEWTPEEAVETGVTSAVFRVMVSGPRVVAVSATESLVGGRPHPIVAWGRAHTAEIVDWHRQASV